MTPSTTNPPATPPAEDKGGKIIAEMSPEELEKNRQRFLYRQGMIDKDPDGDAPTQKEKKDEGKTDDKPKDEKPPEEKPKPEEKPSPSDDKSKTDSADQGKPSRRERRETLTGEVIRDAVEAGARAAIESVKPATPAPAVSADVEMSPKDKKTIEVIRFMEEESRLPKGTADKTIAFWKKETEYVSAWERKNPDKPFNEDDPEHHDFYTNNEPRIDPDEFEQAREDRLIAVVKKQAKEEAKEEARQEIAPEVERLSFERQLEKLEPVIEKRATESVSTLVAEVAPELSRALGDDAQKAFTPATFDKMAEQDPLAAEILQDESERLQLLITEHELLTAFPQRYKADPSHVIKLSSGTEVSPHRLLVNIIRDVELDLVELPKSQTERDGKAFLPKPTMVEREKKIMEDKALTEDRRKAALRDLHERYWTLSPDDIRKALVSEHADSAKKRIEKLTKLFDRKVTKTSKPAEKPSPSTTPSEADPPKDPPSRNSPPAVTASSDKVNTSGSARNGGLSRDEIIDQKMGW